MIRRNRITRLDAQQMLGVMAAAGLLAAFAGCSPTGTGWVDRLFTGLFAAFVVWAAATCPWWALTGAAGAAALLAPNFLLTFVALLAAGGAMWVGGRHESRVPVRCASAGLTVNVMLRLEIDWFWGASALLTIIVLGAVVLLGVQRRHRPQRKRVIVGLAVAGGAAALCSVGLVAGAVQAREELRLGYNDLLAGLDYLQSGRVVDAQARLRTASEQLGEASERFDAPWVRPSRLVPGVAQHTIVMRDVVGEAAAAADAAATALEFVDLEALTVVDGEVDLGAVTLLEDPLAQLQVAVADLRATLDSTDAGWLIDPVQSRLRRYQTRAEQADTQAQAAAAAAVHGPAMLGADEPRRYLLMFTSPAEARGLSGLMGNYSVITIDDGVIRRTGFGRTNDLQTALLAHPEARVDAPAEYFARYGAYGAGDGTTAPRAKYWSNLTMTPDMPTVGRIAAQLYEDTVGDPLDGVFLLDPRGLAALLDVGGSISLDGLDTPLDGSNLEDFLLRDIYEFEENEREDFLEQAAERTVDALLGSTLPAPQTIAAKLGPATTTSHIVGWAVRPEEQEVFRLMGMDGALPALDGRDGLAVVNDNGNGNKIDSFLERSVAYRGTYDSGSGIVEATATVTLRNTAPATGYPDYVIGNLLGLPPGTNRTLLSVYSPLTLLGVEIDGEEAGMARQTELGWNVYSTFVVLEPGQQRVVTVSLRGEVAEGGYSLVLRPQPLANTEEVTVRMDGDADASYEGPLTRRSVLVGGALKALR